MSFFIYMQFDFLKSATSNSKKKKKNCFKHIVITKRVFHICAVWCYSCINENFDFNEDHLISLNIIAITFYTRFWSFCFMTFSYCPYNCFSILSNVLVIIVSTDWNSSKEFGVVHLRYQIKTSSCPHCTDKHEEH